MTTEITTTGGGLIVSAVVVILTILLVKLFSRSGSRPRDGSNNGDGSGDGVKASPGGLPLVPIPKTSYSSSSECWKYDVFLSFRGEDTRKTFVDHIYSALEQHGILTYKDDVTLDRGDTIGPSLMKAIEASQIFVIIFSENYADSSWCLDELSHILNCRDKVTGQIVFPIFYHVDPSDVRKQKGQFGKAFAKHNNNNKVETWKKALVDATNIAGWEPKHVANGHEAKCIQEIVGSILVKLQSSLESEAVEDEDLVGMGTRLKDLKQLLRIGSGGVRMVGIWGIGGGGKTTLATSLYKKLKISGQFHGCCFVENIREESKQNGLKSLQEKILSTVFNKKIQVESVDLGKDTTKGMLCRRNVLIVLDDVDHLDQLEALAGRHNWFGNGSRIIITTRDEQVLKSHRIDEVCPVSLLSDDEAIRLFRKHAYHENNPVENYEKLSLRVISYVNGLPLALKILGSFLYGRDKDEWLGTLARLKDHPEMNILEKLKISYDGLQSLEKELFLDIACFFRWKNKDDAIKMLDACGFHPRIGVKVLIQKALISVSKDGRFDMHDLVQEMAHYIVRGEHPNNPEKHTRLWRDEDVEDICLRNATAENDKIEAIQCVFDHCHSSNVVLLVSNMKKLRYLWVIGRNFDEGPSFLSNELRYIEWHYYPGSPFPESFQPTKLVVLKMKYSLHKELWEGYKYLPCLKELELSNMKALVRTPDFDGLPSLQKLILHQCESLEEIHQSLGNHSSLVCVDICYCGKLTRFPSIVGMEKLEILKTSCKAAVVFPKSKLILSPLPRSLRKLGLMLCGLKDGEIPSEIGELMNLQELDLSYNNLTRLDFSLSRLTRLKLLQLCYCKNLVELPDLPSSLAILKADWCDSLEEVIRDDIHTNCKCLSKVSILMDDRENIIGGERLLETMLQGNAVESGCMSLVVSGVEIPKGFEPRLVKGKRCRMQLPSNWFHHFSGFLICAVFDDIFSRISMKHVEKLEEGDSQHDDVYWEEETDDDDGSKCTWVGYVSFVLLRNTLWWDHTSTSLQIEFNSYDDTTTFGCGLKLVQMETTHSSSSFSEISLDDDRYKCKFDIEHDSKSALECKLW